MNVLVMNFMVIVEAPLLFTISMLIIRRSLIGANEAFPWMYQQGGGHCRGYWEHGCEQIHWAFSHNNEKYSHCPLRRGGGVRGGSPCDCSSGNKPSHNPYCGGQNVHYGAQVSFGKSKLYKGIERRFYASGTKVVRKIKSTKFLVMLPFSFPGQIIP